MPEEELQRTEGPPSGNAPDDSGQDQTHSSIDESNADPTSARRPPINWPATSDTSAWTTMDEDLSGVLSVKLQGNVVQKLAQLAGSIYAYGSERFGVKEKKATEKTVSNLSRRQKEIHDIRARIRTVSKQWKQARKKGDVIEMDGLDEIREEMLLRWMVWMRSGSS